MNWKEPTWDEMDLIYQDDEPVPEGKENISEKDFDRILQIGEEDDE